MADKKYSQYTLRATIDGTEQLAGFVGGATPDNLRFELPTIRDWFLGGAAFTERVQDVVGSWLADAGSLDFTYNDAANTLSLTLVNDQLNPGANKLYGTDGSGAKGWYDQPTPGSGSGLTAEEVRDLIGSYILDAGSLDATFNDAGDTFQITLVNDQTSPGNNKLYGTNGSGVKGWYDQPGPGSGWTRPFRLIEWAPATGATSIATRGGGATISGTLSHPDPVAGTFYDEAPKSLLASSAAANSSAGLRMANPCLWRGDAATRGGFTWVHTFAVVAFNADARAFVGLTNDPGGIGNSNDPSATSAWNDIIGIEKGTADTNWFFVHRAGTAAATRTNTGFAVTAGEVLRLEISCAANGSSYAVRLARYTGSPEALSYSSAVDAISPITSNIPGAAVMLGPQMEIRTVAATAAVQIANIYGYGEGGA